MSTKPPKAKQKIADITPPRKASGAALPQIVIEKRAHLERPEGPGADNASAPARPTAPQAPAAASAPAVSVQPTAAAPSTAPQAEMPATSKRTVITPPEDTETAAAETAPKEAEATVASVPAVPAGPSATESASPAADIDESEDGSATTDETVDETKAAKEAEAAARRDQELEKFIDTKQFFVPINKEARKRSLKVTLWLTALYIFLSLVLVNLMLDTGMILLLQKLPHTNFFSV